MSSYRIDAALQWLDDMGDASADSWANARDFSRFSEGYTQLSAGQFLVVGGDIQSPSIIDMSNETFTLDRDGLEALPLAVVFGAKSNYFYTGLDQESLKLMGDRSTPHKREDADGRTLFEIDGDYQLIQGVQAYNFGTVFNCTANLTGLQFVDIKVENVDNCIVIASGSANTVISNLATRDCANQAIRIEEDANGVYINDFSIHGAGNEDGEPRFINIRDNHSNVNISNGSISSAIDGYVGTVPNDNGDYNQGDGISIEVGGTVNIHNVTINGCTDRGCDIKAYTIMSHVEAYDCKIGVASWNGCDIKDTYIANPKTNSVNAGIGFQAVSGECVYTRCGVDLGGDLSGHNDPTMAFRILAGTTIVKGGVYNIASTSIFAKSSAGTQLVMRNVEVNGVLYSGTKTFTSDTDWNVGDGFDA